MTVQLEQIEGPVLPGVEFASTDGVRAAFLDAINPDPLMTVSEWAEERRELDRTTSGEPGPWRNSRTPYLVEIMDALSPTSKVETVIFLAGSQVGKTEVGNNWMGYVVDIAPGPMLFVLPTEGTAESVSKERLKPLFERTPALKGKVQNARTPGSGTTLLRKEFPGGSIKLVAAQAPAQLRSTPARYLFGDEVDAYPASSGDEGDPCELAARAQITFRRRKRLWTSTPTIHGHSKIETLFETTDQRHYLVPCPHCGHEQRLEWSGMEFDSKARGEALVASVAYRCASCEERIEESAKDAMVAAGRWEASCEAEDPKARGYHLSALYSPFFKWSELVRKWLAAQGDPAKLQVFVNLYLAETWKEKADVPDWNRLYERREAYDVGTVPRGGVFLTAGVDIQHDRFELEVVAWGPRRESWSVDYVVVSGKTDLPATQEKLAQTLAATYRHESSVELPIRLIAIDSGDQTTLAYDLVKRIPRAIAVKGAPGRAQVITAPAFQSTKASGRRKRKRGGAAVHMVGTHLVKEELYAGLRLPSPVDGEPAAHGFCHFPAAYSEGFFRGLTAEELVRRRNKKGFTVREWRKTSERNEPLDCRVYARAAAAWVGLDRWTDRKWEREREEAGLDGVVFAPEPPKTKAREARRRGGGRFSRWRKP
ncbi:MAG: phage terminase large subunit family protein [Planctomycetota bacterium]